LVGVSLQFPKQLIELIIVLGHFGGIPARLGDTFQGRRLTDVPTIIKQLTRHVLT
jgi:hypothetical protein